MKIIRITFKSGQQYFIKENRGAKGMQITRNVKEAFQYRTELEFKVTWKLFEIRRKAWLGYDNAWKQKADVVKFESIDIYTLTPQEFDIKSREIEFEHDIALPTEDFNRIKRCGITSSNWCYGKDDEWIAFVKEEDKPRISRVRYYRRGLTHTMTSHNNWLDRYDEHSWHGCYEIHHKSMLNPIIQQICLLDQDCCYEYNITELKIS